LGGSDEECRKLAMSPILICVIGAALFFDFTNGFHDAANAIGTSISTRAIKPAPALLLAASLNFVGALLSTSIAATIATGIVEPASVTLPIVLAGLMAAIVWNLYTWYRGIPSSSSHCLVGGIAGAVVVGYGMQGVHWTGILFKVLIPTIASPLLGFAAGLLFTAVLTWFFRRSQPGVMNRRFRGLQLISASGMALSHGLNDAQKTMGIITLALFASGTIAEPEVPTWVKAACAVVMGLGTFSGGKRIIKTLGMRIVHLTPMDGFSAQTAGTGVLQIAAYLGLPVSTTHAITATVMGVGSAHRVKAVRWGVTYDIMVAWFITLPIAGMLGAAFTYLFLVWG
jgi:PiT family inorganic phosphate transporter